MDEWLLAPPGLSMMMIVTLLMTNIKLGLILKISKVA